MSFGTVALDALTGEDGDDFGVGWRLGMGQRGEEKEEGGIAEGHQFFSILLFSRGASIILSWLHKIWKITRSECRRFWPLA